MVAGSVEGSGGGFFSDIPACVLHVLTPLPEYAIRCQSIVWEHNTAVLGCSEVSINYSTPGKWSNNILLWERLYLPLNLLYF